MEDRPLECSHCQKPADITYEEISEETTSCMRMCKECPILAKKLHGTLSLEEPVTNNTTESSCLHCHTTLENIQTGEPLGCDICYQTFDHALIEKLCIEKLIPASLEKNKLLTPSDNLHQGKSPLAFASVSFSHQWDTLHQALADAVQKEQYEQAAWLRDELKKLKETASER